MNERVKQTLDAVLERFRSDEIPEAVAYAMFPIPDLPSTRWSILNRTIMLINGTCDARGFRQWQQVKRFVKKGAKALHILIPLTKKVERDGKEKPTVYGFGCQAVFRVEDTDGEPLEYENLDPGPIPLIERAKEWGISVRAVPHYSRYAAYYALGQNEICLATKEEIVFFHELAHVAHEKVLGALKPGQDPLQEIVAQLAGECLCRLVGKSGDRYFGNSYRYIGRYASEIQMSPHRACMKVIGDTEKVLALILAPPSRKEVPDDGQGN